MDYSNAAVKHEDGESPGSNETDDRSLILEIFQFGEPTAVFLLKLEQAECVTMHFFGNDFVVLAVLTMDEEFVCDGIPGDEANPVVANQLGKIGAALEDGFGTSNGSVDDENFTDRSVHLGHLRWKAGAQISVHTLDARDVADDVEGNFCTRAEIIANS